VLCDRLVSKALPHRTLGSSAIEVSVLSLGSWKTYERLSREEGLAVMLAARERGIGFLDDARYNDETGTAPIPTGYSEVVFGELFRAAGWRRDEVVVANKLWWEFWPEQSAAEELDASLERMGFDYLDLAYSWVAPEGPSVAEIVASAGALVAAGKLRAWGTGNWPPELLAEAARIAAAEGLPPPCAAQLPYSLVHRDSVESPAAEAALAESGASVVASYTLAGGVLTGKYAGEGAHGRLAGKLVGPELAPELAAAEKLRRLAERVDATPAALAIAFALANPRVASALFGATRPEQVADNLQAVEVLGRLSETELAELRAIGT
jgi:aryl-alcohol dehydrogenase-like predicted oxidoreductase